VHGCDAGGAADGYEWIHQEASRGVTVAANRAPGR
jgi:hypothetical protein